MNNGEHSEAADGSEIYGACCNGTGWVICDHAATPKDEDGWCEPCGEPATGKTRRWCENRVN